jgi:hypothetical protein
MSTGELREEKSAEGSVPLRAAGLNGGSISASPRERLRRIDRQPFRRAG